MFGIILLGILCPQLPHSSVAALSSPKWASEFRPYGAYVDEIEFVLFTGGETAQAILALEKGDVDAYDERVLEDYVVPLYNNENIQVTFTPNVRYRVLTLNCERFPLNITAFRRAMAFGFDKYGINQECIWEPVIPLDSYFPITATEWEVESQLNDHFYEADFDSGNKSLENAGFKDVDGDGWREYVDANDSIIYEDNEYADGGILELFATAGYIPAIKVCVLLEHGLEAMGIRTETVEPEYWVPDDIIRNNWVNTWIEGVPLINPPELLYDNFRTGAKWNKNPYNYYHFSNSTIDSVLDQMVEATTLEDAKTYAREANRLLTFEQPQIVCYNYVDIDAFRTDKFEGWFEFAGSGWTRSDNWACATKLHLKEDLGGPWGETFKYCLSDDIDTLNPYLLKTKYEETVFQYIYERLWNIDPNTWDPIPGLAYDWEIEQTSANGEIRDGQKFTFYLYDNETWHDEELFTAADVNHSLYLWKSSPHSGPEMADVYKVEMPDGPDGHIIELYVNKTGHFEWADTTHFYITPEHIWREVTNVSAFVPTDDQTIGTGPYRWNEYVPGESINLLRHENWRWALHNDSTPTSTTSSEGSPTMTSSEGDSTSSVTSTTTPSFTSFMTCGTFLGLLVIRRSRRKRMK
ncbi:MAG: ABC transporter substrate-binding protein [Candidatus Thorarchaeota archaeon]